MPPRSCILRDPRSKRWWRRTALETGEYQTDTEIPAGSSYTLPGTVTQLTNAVSQADGSDGKITLEDAMAYSSNTAFAQLGVALGDDKVSSMAKKLGFDSPITVDGSDSTGTPWMSVASKFPTDTTDDKLALASIGQGDTVVTPLQNALVAAAVANGGKVMQPTLVDRVRSSDLSVISQTKPQVMSRAFSSGTANKLTQMMEAVVTKENPNLPSTACRWLRKPVPHRSVTAIRPSTAGWSLRPGGRSEDRSCRGGAQCGFVWLVRGGSDYEGDDAGGAGRVKLIEGQLIHRRYRLDARLAQGGMGEVWKGYDIQLGRPVAIKALRGDLGVTQEAKLLRLRAEAHNSANLAHPNIAALFEYYEHDGIGFLVMEYVPSKSLADLFHEQNGPMEPTVCCRFSSRPRVACSSRIRMA